MGLVDHCPRLGNLLYFFTVLISVVFTFDKSDNIILVVNSVATLRKLYPQHVDGTVYCNCNIRCSKMYHNAVSSVNQCSISNIHQHYTAPIRAKPGN